ncbi:DUF4041 domain-containing protein [Rothia halotolerans]|uniref:DUF4041 domain-containing protein n=1 Tax=Rothia halotolerans TaxID=405770 RepID=UPI00192DBDBE|nr:DUF4041 domain-containing protein [Rothia halotolerans]
MSDFANIYGGPTPVERIEPTKIMSHFSGGAKKVSMWRMAEEISRLNMELEQVKANHHHLESFLHHHGGPEVWTQDVLLHELGLKVSAEQENLENIHQQAIAEAQAARDETTRQMTALRREADEYAHSTRRDADAYARESHRKVDTQTSQRRQEADAYAADVISKADAYLAETISDADEYALASRNEVKELRASMPQLRVESALSAAALEDFAHPARTYIDLQNELRTNRSKIKQTIVDDEAVEYEESLPEKPSQQQRFAKNIAKLAVRCFNAETENIIKSATASNMDASLNKINRSADAIERLTSPMVCRVDYGYQHLKSEELELAVKAEAARKIEREAERERRAELKEQARIDAELQAQRDRLEKEKSHYETVLSRIETVGDADRASEIQQQIIEIEAGIADVDYRQANQKAGYVYVISNVGAFGEQMVKIGMTRRLDPMDRVKELGDASVPFGFDVHALFFSENAVEVESNLHRHFESKRVNRINTRREFFHATPAQVRDALATIQGDLLEFIEVPEAEQYRASVAMSHGE